jgi:alkylhydroperoxidase/carboxymuconolactone decarboxylase family protein YurZ
VDAVELLRRYCIDDHRLVVRSSVLAADTLDARTRALVRIAALVASRASDASFHTAVGDAVGSGASVDEIVAILECTRDIVGLPGVVSAAPRIAAALGYDDDLLADTGP